MKRFLLCFPTCFPESTCSGGEGAGGEPMPLCVGGVGRPCLLGHPHVTVLRVCSTSSATPRDVVFCRGQTAPHMGALEPMGSQPCGRHVLVRYGLLVLGCSRTSLRFPRAVAVQPLLPPAAFGAGGCSVSPLASDFRRVGIWTSVTASEGKRGAHPLSHPPSTCLCPPSAAGQLLMAAGWWKWHGALLVSQAG